MPREEELDLDELLSVLGNPLRREILARVAKETHYPLQLSKELGVSQQAIMKHLLILKKYRLVRICERKSTSLGPPRKCYAGTGRFSIRIDLGPSDFETRLIPIQEKEKRDAPGVPEFEERFLEAHDVEDPGSRLRAYKDLVLKLNEEVEGLERRRVSLTALKQHILREASFEISRMSQDYHERRMLYMLTEQPGMPLDDVARIMNIQREALARMYHQLLQDSW